MAWRPTEFLIEGELDNTVPNKVTGWMKFWGRKNKIKFDLDGDFHRDIRGAKIHFRNDKYENTDPEEARKYLAGLKSIQTGAVGDITAGLPPCDYEKYPYLEWYSEENGRVVIELEPNQVEVIGTPIPWLESFPVDRTKQRQNMEKFLSDVSKSLKKENK